MGRGRKGTGVEARESSLRVSFAYQGQRCRETLELAPTPANIKYAVRLVDDIRRRIANGTFNYAEFFPNSPRAKKAAPLSFFALADLWLAAQGNLEAATRDQYAGAVRRWKTLLGNPPVQELAHAEIAAVIGSHAWASAKSLNNALIALRGILGLHFRGRLAIDNPMIGIENRPVIKRPPDPLTPAERDAILADMAKHYDERIWAYFAFMFFSGMRPEEGIALEWGDVDTRTALARVQRVRTFRGTERDGSKTHTVRDVDLVGLAVEALAVMKPYTFMKRDEEGNPVNIFENPVTGRPWHDERSQRDHYWKPTLRRLGIRSRRAYATRHTYATAAIMGGVKPAYVAQQLGHDVKQLFDRYARWIKEADTGSDKRALQAVMSANLPMNCPREDENSGKPLKSLGEIGRRDWTRTKKAGN